MLVLVVLVLELGLGLVLGMVMVLHILLLLGLGLCLVHPWQDLWIAMYGCRLPVTAAITGHRSQHPQPCSTQPTNTHTIYGIHPINQQPNQLSIPPPPPAPLPPALRAGACWP